MSLGQQLLFFFSALGAFNGLVLGIYFLGIKQPKTRSNLFFGLLLLALSVRVGQTLLFYFNDNIPTIFLQLGVAACFFIGPSLFFYIQSTFTPGKSSFLKPKILYGTMAGLLVTGWFIFPYSKNPDLWCVYGSKAAYGAWIIFTIYAGYIYWKNRSSVPSSQNQQLAKVIYAGSLLVLLSYLHAFSGWVKEFCLSGSIVFSLVLYLNAFLFAGRNKTGKIPEEKEEAADRNETKYPNKKILPENAERLISKLENLIKKEGLYKNPNLKLSDLARQMNISTHQLSQLLNDNLGKSFSSYINECRIKEACEKILTDVHIKIEEIGYDVGFNSKSTFFAAFKKFTDTTPLLYREKIARLEKEESVNL